MTWVRRFPFTICLLSAVSLAAGLAHFFPGSIPADWSESYGFAPRHFASGDLLRLITSVFLTHDGLHFAFAVTMISFVVAWAERNLGTSIAICIFALSHLTSMLVFAIGVGALQSTSVRQSVSALYDFHDVGPSAGYYGCLGAVLVAAHLTYKRVVAVGLIAFLMLRIFISAKFASQSHALLSADLVHLLAALVGMSLGTIFARFGRERKSNVPEP